MFYSFGHVIEGANFVNSERIYEGYFFTFAESAIGTKSKIFLVPKYMLRHTRSNNFLFFHVGRWFISLPVPGSCGRLRLTTHGRRDILRWLSYNI